MARARTVLVSFFVSFAHMADAFNNNNSIMVVNIGGTSDDRYRITGLYKKYLDNGGTEVATCQVKRCDDPATATAHVRMIDLRRSGDWFLTRLCAKHNHHTNDEPMPLRKNAKLIAVRDVR